MSRRRIYVGAEAKRVVNSGVVRDLTDLAAFVGADEPTTEAIGAAAQRRYGAHLHAKEAYLPRRERWLIRFLRTPRGWATTGERTWPDPTGRRPGHRLPEYVRLAALLDDGGVLSRSMAPRRSDLPDAIGGTWKSTGATARGVPRLLLTVDAPRHGVVVLAPSTPLDPVQIRFPARTRPVRESLKGLADRYHATKKATLGPANERRRLDALARAEAKAAARRERAAVLPVHEP